MEQYENLNGLILRSRDYKEADQLLTVYSLEQGKLTVRAGGVKKTTSRLRSGVLLFSQSKLVIANGKGFPTVTAAEPIEAFPLLRSDFARMSYAGYAAELLDQVLAEGHPDDGIFRLILQEFYLLEHVDPYLAVLYLEVELLRRLGYPLDTRSCQNCGAPLQGNTLRGDRYQGVHGGMLCRNCAKSQNSVMPDVECVAVLQALEAMPLHQLDRIHISRSARETLDRYMDFQLQQILNRPLKSKAFLKQLNL